ncbi:hypothetical protein A3Q56_03104 [Intoshia linei]|uniref:Uncharacterized protein n=1 Tax=Intoshia linei TaxID=1819745 RepID=A0A177B476_9BILA|nr:hypothetical protein A3Q56_03104 [Intoshia linei]
MGKDVSVIGIAFVVNDATERTLAKFKRCLNVTKTEEELQKLKKSGRKYSYVYFDSDMETQNLPFEIRYGLNTETDNPLFNTLESFFNDHRDRNSYIIYNDNHGEKRSFSGGGHSKGVIMANKIEGFWIMHSVPGFLNLEQKSYTFSNKAHKNAQMFFCVTMDVHNLQNLVDKLQLLEPHVIDENYLALIKKRKTKFTLPVHLVEFDLVTQESMPIHVGLKTQNAKFCLYDQFISKRYDHEINMIPSFKFLEKRWRGSMDHSKWAYTSEKLIRKGLLLVDEPDLALLGLEFCVCDLNAHGSKNRGGLCSCFKSPKLVDIFHKASSSEYNCKDGPESNIIESIISYFTNCNY